jgi:hypothetical protein
MRMEVSAITSASVEEPVEYLRGNLKLDDGTAIFHNFGAESCSA